MKAETLSGSGKCLVLNRMLWPLELGDDWTQRKISLLEQKETIDPEILEQVAKVLKVPVGSNKKF